MRAKSLSVSTHIHLIRAERVNKAGYTAELSRAMGQQQ